MNNPEILCPYCGKDRPVDQFTDEHVIPRALGGAVEPTNPFSLRVCKDCNTFCGRHVDAPAIRGWLPMLARGALRTGGGARDAPPMPIIPIGRLDGWSEGGTICEFWVGPAGNSVFHFHRPYPFGEVMIRGAPGAKKDQLDPGVVLIGVVPTNPAWFPIIVRSVRATFGPDAYVYTLNAPPGVPAAFSRHVAWIESLPAEKVGHSVIDLHAGERFAAKLALGFGSIVLGEAFRRSSDATALRAFVRGQEPDGAARLRGIPPFSPGRDHGDLLKFRWGSCHTILLLPVGEILSLAVVLYGTEPLATTVTADRRLWEGSIRDGGVAWVIAPGLRRFAGPSSVPEMLIDMQSEPPAGPLTQLDTMLKAVPPLPSLHLTTDG